MPCYKPVTVFVPLGGGPISYHEKPNCREATIPCGHCIGCRIERQNAWAFRCMAEASMHEHNWFATLTYDEEHCPSDYSLVS